MNTRCEHDLLGELDVPADAYYDIHTARASRNRAGIGQIKLPALQPGSSITPGKVNHVATEAVTQAAIQIMGNDHAILTPVEMTKPRIAGLGRKSK